MPCRAGPTAFSDLIFNEMVATCPNKQLDTVVGSFLKEKVGRYEYSGDGALEVSLVLSDVNSKFKFIPGVSFRFFKENLATKNSVVVGEGILKSVQVDGKNATLWFGKECKLGAVDSPEKFGPLCIAPGKTHGISRTEQLLWQTEDHVVKTMVYGLVDVLLTVLLADRVKSGAELAASAVLMLPPFTEVDLRSKSGQKIQILHADLFKRAGIFQAKITMPQQIAFYTRALEIEGTKREHAKNYTKDDSRLSHYPLVETGCASTLREIMEMKYPNLPEFQLGITTSVDATNRRELDERIKQLLKYV